MVVDGDGNVGIGTDNPGSYTLDVNGTAHLPSIHRTSFTKELSENFELISGGGSVTLYPMLLEINVTGTNYTDQSEYAGTIDLDIFGQRTNSTYGEDIIKTQLHFTAAWNEQSDAWQRLQFNQEIKAQDINSYKCIDTIPEFRYKYAARKLQIFIQYNAQQYRIQHSFTARVSSDQAFADDIISSAGGTVMGTGTVVAAVQGICYGTGGNVGIGTNNPENPLHVFGVRADSTPTHGVHIFGRSMNVAGGTAGVYAGIEIHQTGGAEIDFGDGSGTNDYKGRISYQNSTNQMLFFTSGTQRCKITTGVPITFTGQHRCVVDGIISSDIMNYEGMIVSSKNNKYIKLNDGVEQGSNAITINESIPLVSLSIKVKDKSCFGVISASEDPDSREETNGSITSIFEKELGDTRVYINSLGEGAIWVTNINGTLESGDYITTSNVVGYGQKQESEFLANYTVAKITMDCDFNPVTQPIQNIKKELGNVNYWVKTTFKTITEEEYSNITEENRRTTTKMVYTNEEGEITQEQYNALESNIQSTYSELTQTIYQKITKKESKTEQEGYELEVRQELVNVLDEHGQMQWEDHPTETEKAYKIRYLDANGVITDEANAVHTAAFVGCTYHCG